MLIEIKDVRQFEDDDFRRWFTDEFFDLIIWYNKDGGITGFQLCYDKPQIERALTWRPNQGFSHTKIDDGETPGQAKMTPILVADGQFSKKSIAEMFISESRQIDQKVAHFVYEKILAYPGGLSGS